ncbi:hypothetical protein JJJ17_09680 [Paracoccus caeni]|uniref:Uncharacterized protein n=1 Tax=Paracoccus caeni TaxID=657651 RepID=A0A934SKQ9_9RHOB|nr:hypothetical protein [Paracoccus caeni]MBK4216193.1 hypothetical protein [Paracoccus caeni]
MRADVMTWLQRLVAAVFVLGVLALLGVVVLLVRQSTGLPPLPIFAGLAALVALILLAGACLALLSIAVSASRGVEALNRLADQPAQSVSSPKPVIARPFEGPSLREIAQSVEPEPQPAMTAPTRPLRPAGRTLVAER